MAILEWYQIVSAVLFANGLTLYVIYGLWTVTKVERNGGKPENAPFTALLAIIIPILIAIGGVALTTT